MYNMLFMYMYTTNIHVQCTCTCTLYISAVASPLIICVFMYMYTTNIHVHAQVQWLCFPSDHMCIHVYIKMTTCLCTFPCAYTCIYVHYTFCLATIYAWWFGYCRLLLLLLSFSACVTGID